MLAYIQISEKSKKQIESKAEVLIILTWPDFANEDIDMWLLLPTGQTVSFNNKDVGSTHLERDDRGIISDTAYINNVMKVIRLNKEVITFRALVPGKYTVNVHYYSKALGASYDETNVKTIDPPYKAKVTLAKINPSYEELVNSDVLIETVGQERTAFSFRINDKMEIVDINFTPVTFVVKAKTIYHGGFY